MNITKAYYQNEKMIDEMTGKETVQFAERVNGNLHSFKYIHAGIDFRKRENRFARGLTLDENDNIVTIGFEKFFNELQLEDYKLYDETFKEERARIQKTDNIVAYEKLDGSLIILGLYDNDIVVSTTIGVHSKQADIAKKYLKRLKNIKDIKKYMSDNNVCLMFEMIGKQNPLVVNYGVDLKLVLLGQTNKTTFVTTLAHQMTNKLGFSVPKAYHFSYKELKDIQKNTRDIEGFVVVNDYGNLIKFKTDWYFNANRTSQLFFNTESITKADIDTILQAIFDDKLDDLLSYQNRTNAKTKKVNLVVKAYRSILKEAQSLLSLYDCAADIANADCDKTICSIAINMMLHGRKTNESFNLFKKEIRKRLESI